MTWNTLDHPNVLPLLGVTMDDEQFVMVSEWMSNGNINQFIKTHKDANRFKLVRSCSYHGNILHSRSPPTARRRCQGFDIHTQPRNGARGSEGGRRPHQSQSLSNSLFFTQANILVDPNGHARLADFGFLTITSDSTNPTVSSSFAVGGTIRWMSPELFYPDNSGLRGARPTKQSDCYAFGMVIYEVLGGQAPFASFHNCVVMCKVIGGERPGRPNGPEGAQFTDDLWQTLNWCWAAQPQDRPCVTTVLERLERVPRSLKTPSLKSDESRGTDVDEWGIGSDSSSR
jgi:serine/threonine protein kinase